MTRALELSALNASTPIDPSSVETTEPFASNRIVVVDLVDVAVAPTIPVELVEFSAIRYESSLTAMFAIGARFSRWKNSLPVDSWIAQYSEGTTSVRTAIAVSFLKLQAARPTNDWPMAVSRATTVTCLAGSPGSSVHRVQANVCWSNVMPQTCLLSSAQRGLITPGSVLAPPSGLPNRSRNCQLPPLAYRPSAKVCPSGAIVTGIGVGPSLSVARGLPDQSNPMSHDGWFGS